MTLFFTTVSSSQNRSLQLIKLFLGYSHEISILLMKFLQVISAVS